MGYCLYTILPVLLSPPCMLTHHGCCSTSKLVILELYFSTFVDQLCKQNWIKHTAGVQWLGARGGFADPDGLGSPSLEIQEQVAEGGGQTQEVQLFS